MTPSKAAPPAVAATAASRLAVLGAAGRMGRAVIQAANAAQLPVGAAFEREGVAELGRDALELAGLDARGVTITTDLTAAADAFDVLVDFTRPEGTIVALDT
ncbi:MAG: hypothetical protein ACREUE_09645, partial [Panacagrimonas sp.]